MKKIVLPIIVIATVFTFTSCEPETKYSIDPELEPFVNSFYEEAAARGVSLPKDNLRVQLIPLQTISTFSVESGQRYIKFDIYTFNNNKDDSGNYIEAKIFHELAIALLNKEPDTTEGGTGIMNVYVKISGYRDEDRSLLLDELFDVIK